MSLITTERHGAIAVLTLNRPDTLNALGGDGDAETAATAQAISHATADHREGVAALIQKRPPAFGGA